MDRAGLFCCLLLCLKSVHATAGDLVGQARSLALAGQRAKALEMLEAQLSQEPNDVDARLLYGIVLSWEGRYQEARRALEAVLKQSPDYSDAREALIRVETWSGDYERLEKVAREGQARDPANAVYSLALARALKELHRYKEALACVNNLLLQDPQNTKAIRLKQGIEEDLRRWEVGVGQFYSWFSDGRSSWKEEQVKIGRYTPVGKALLRLSQATRFDRHSRLIEVEAYPRLRRGSYVFLSGAASPDRILYPAYRFGGELFQNLPHSFEASLGIRRFRFGSPFNLYTGSISRYFGPWWLTVRTFLTRVADGRGPSYQFYVRRYFDGHERYFGFRYGLGASPFDVRSVNEIEVLRSNTFLGEINWNFQGRWMLNVLAGMSAQDRAGRAALRQYVLDGSLHYKF